LPADQESLKNRVLRKRRIWEKRLKLAARAKTHKPQKRRLRRTDLRMTDSKKKPFCKKESQIIQNMRVRFGQLKEPNGILRLAEDWVVERSVRFKKLEKQKERRKRERWACLRDQGGKKHTRPRDLPRCFECLGPEIVKSTSFEGWK